MFLSIIFNDAEFVCYFKAVNKTTRNVEVSIEYKPVSIGRLRLWMTVEGSLDKMKELGRFLSIFMVHRCVGVTQMQ